ncbi:MAG: hypothetical protein JWN08_1776 [Frankiales bacterium]|jgi:hypothetical protein|nr:hypothetical protein [Frankiales bacterium]
MTPTRPAALLGLVVGFALLGWLLAAAAYGSLPVLPLLAPLTTVVLAVVEVAMSRVVRDRLSDRPKAGGRPLHPLQIARAAVLARASSTGGAVLLGAYSGLLAWTLPRRGDLLSTERDAVVAGLSALAALGLVAAALLLERACRTPIPPDRTLGSRT